MKVYYNQRFVYKYVDFSICPCARIELNQNYKKSEVDELILKEIIKFSIENDIPVEDHWLFLEYFITIE